MHEFIPKSVLDQYDIGQVKSVVRVHSGLVHHTYMITTNQGSFVIQKLHEVLCSKEIGDDFLAVTTFLNEHGFPAPKAVVTTRGDVLARSGDSVWRMQTAIEGESFDRLDDTSMIEQAGLMLGRFHRTIADITTPLKTCFVLPPNPTVVFEKFKVAQNDVPLDALLNAEDYEAVLEMVNFTQDHLPRLLLPDDLPPQIIHGDPKISNFMFRKGECVALIDLDTCNSQSVLMELGDAFRSWCGGLEDDPNNTFSMDKFTVGWRGYMRGAGDFLSERERALVSRAIQLVTLELACRFLTDVFYDNYFGWDQSRYDSRRAHNLARARGQIAEYVDVKGKNQDMTNILY
jgi:Ser/Thr protein kinase RdoA (MazF antagonist)